MGQGVFGNPLAPFFFGEPSMKHEVRAIRLGDILFPDVEKMTPKQVRFHRTIREKLPKAFHWSDRERMIFVSLVKEAKEVIPEVILGEYNHVAEMVPKDHPNYTLIFEPETDRTLIFDGTRYWKWKPREEWVTARRKTVVEQSEPVPVLSEEVPVFV